MAYLQLTEEWGFELETSFRRRTEDDSLAFWRPQQTIWLQAWGTEETAEETLVHIRADANPNPTKVFETVKEGVLHYGYLLPKADGEERAWGLTAFCITQGDYLLLAFYFDEVEMLDWALECWNSVSYTGR